jgi:hypothetical protein
MRLSRIVESVVSGEMHVLVWVGAFTASILLVGWLGRVPGARARRRRNRNATFIGVLGWIGIVVWPLWVVALVWASRRSRRGAAAVTDLWVPVTCRERPGHV